MSLQSFIVNRFLPKQMVGIFASPYIGGYSIDGIMKVLKHLHSNKILASIDLLGEDVHSHHKAIENKNYYLEILNNLSQSELDLQATISLKLSSLTQVKSISPAIQLDEVLLDEALREIFELSQKLKINVTIDMEDHPWTTYTLEKYKYYLNQGYDHLGTVLQTMLHRTEKDIDELPENSRIRICIGIYKEPASIALLNKQEMKERMLTLSRKLLDKNIYTEFATHDQQLIYRFVEEVVLAKPYPIDRFEFQMLLGVPRDNLQKSLVNGDYSAGLGAGIVRLYVPFASNKDDAMAYAKRRLAANPDIISHGIKNILHLS